MSLVLRKLLEHDAPISSIQTFPEKPGESQCNKIIFAILILIKYALKMTLNVKNMFFDTSFLFKQVASALKTFEYQTLSQRPSHLQRFREQKH